MIELPVMKYESVLERRNSPPRTRSTSSRERRVGLSSISDVLVFAFEALGSFVG